MPGSSTPCETPTKPTWPPGRVERIACIIDFLGADRLDHRVRAEPIGQLLDPRHAFVAALGHDVGRAELAGKLLPRLVSAHRDDALGAQLLRGQHRAQADRAVADDRDRLARARPRRVGAEPAGAQDVGGRQQARDQVVGWHLRGGDQGAVGQRDAQQGGLRAARATYWACTHRLW